MTKDYSINSNKRINRNMAYLRSKCKRTNPEILEDITNALVQVSQSKIEPLDLIVKTQGSTVIVAVVGQEPVPIYFSGKATAPLPEIIGAD